MIMALLLLAFWLFIHQFLIYICSVAQVCRPLSCHCWLLPYTFFANKAKCYQTHISHQTNFKLAIWIKTKMCQHWHTKYNHLWWPARFQLPRLHPLCVTLIFWPKKTCRLFSPNFNSLWLWIHKPSHSICTLGTALWPWPLTKNSRTSYICPSNNFTKSEQSGRFCSWIASLYVKECTNGQINKWTAMHNGASYWRTTY